MFGAEIRQFPVPTREIKRRRCKNLKSPKHCVLQRFEFDAVFDPTDVDFEAVTARQLNCNIRNMNIVIFSESDIVLTTQTRPANRIPGCSMR